MGTGPCPDHHRCFITIFLYPHSSINDVGSHHRLLILPGLGIIYGGSPQPPLSVGLPATMDKTLKIDTEATIIILIDGGDK